MSCFWDDHRSDTEMRRAWEDRRPHSSLCLAFLAMLLVLTASGPSCGQDLPRDFEWPKLMLNGQAGHIAPAWAVAFSPDGRYLVSGGDDKRIQVWEFREGEPRLDRTIRPPLQRNGGDIRALAISPRPDPTDGHFLLAAAGLGATGKGDILIYRLSGRADQVMDELAFELKQGKPSQKAAADGRSGATPGGGVAPLTGHSRMVYGLSFSPDGRHLASCGEDGTIRIWDLGRDEGDPAQARPAGPQRSATGVIRDRRPVRVLRGHAGQVRHAIFLDDDRLVSFGSIGDGSVLLWSWRESDRPSLAIHVPDSEHVRREGGVAVQINAIAAGTASDGRRFVVTGRESGELELFRESARGTWKRAHLNPDDLSQHRSIEGLALSPDGSWLAVSQLKEPLPPANLLPRTECEVTLWKLQQAGPVQPIRVAADVVRAVAFSPNGRFLVTIGGEAQELVVHELRPDGRKPTFEVRGPGTELWDVGFLGDAPNSPAIAFARNRPRGQEVAAWEGFDLPGRRFVSIDRPDQLHRAIIQSDDGWTLRPIRLTELLAERPGSEPVRLVLDRTNVRWTAYTFIPPSAAHPRLSVAIGCREGMVAIYTLPDGKKTREFLGHAGPVYGVAPSPDGRWLLTGSADQTIGLWSLAGCDVRPTLGARFEPDAQGALVVREITPRGFADQRGIKVGDRITKAEIIQGARVSGQIPLEPGRLDAFAEEARPGAEIQLLLTVPRPDVPPIRVAFSRRDQPLLKLLAATNKEWIAWMPEGYYDTSIAGDRRLVGWHVNRVERFPNGDLGILPSDFHPMSRFERLLHRRDAIDRLLATGDPGIPAPPPLASLTPPAIRFFQAGPQGAPIAEPVLQAQQPALALRIDAIGAPGRQVASVRVFNSNVPNPPQNLPPRAGPNAAQSLVETIRLWPGDNLVSVEAVDNLGIVGRGELLVRYQRQAAPTAAARLVIRTLGIGQFAASDIPAIRCADRDAEALAEFFHARGESPARDRHFDSSRIDEQVRNTRIEPRMGSREIRRVFDDLKAEAEQGKLRAGDTVLLSLESHLFDFGNGPIILGHDTRLQGKATPGIASESISEDLKYVTRAGALVVLFLDGIHDELPLRTERNLTDWIRKLRDEARVIVIVASKQEKSEPGDRGLSRFTEAVRESITVRETGRRLESPNLEEFRDIVVRSVLARTSRRQHADLYAPDNIAIHRIRIFEPQPRPTDDLVSK